MRPILIDGSMGEGGGQILRTSISISAVTGRPIRIVNIRAKRSNPGLQRQHLTGVQAVATISNAVVREASVGSTELEFIPGELRGGSFEFNIGTAGSVTLVLQALAPLLFYLPGPVRIVITGGTDVPWSPTIDYVREVLAWFLRRLGLKVTISLQRRGHYPRGGGRVEVVVEDPPGSIEGLELPERGGIVRFGIRSHCVNLPQHVCERQASSAERVIRSHFGDAEVRVELEPRSDGFGPGSGLAVWSYTEKSVLGADSLGEKGKRAEVVGEEAAVKLVEDLSTGAALDRFMSDMIIPFLALARGRSIVTGARLTLHALTNIEVVRLLVPEASIQYEGREDGFFKLRVEGAAITRK
jgi:RNA 3'-terminal phosphate cyclase (ATP)